MKRRHLARRERGPCGGVHNVVRHWIVVSDWNGAEPFVPKSPRAADLPHVVIVQGADHGPILAAAAVE
jgi:hypothetical protein